MIQNYIKITVRNFLKKPGYTIINIVGLVVVITCWLFILPIQSQDQQTGISISDQQEPLPSLNDWFLSTGNWENDPQLYVREFGNGSDTIIMLHGGWGAEHSGLIDAVKDLKDQYRFIFYDQRGSLRSPFPDSLITFDHHIEDLELLRKELKLDKLTIVGHSMGAILASAYASKYPRNIEQLTLLAPAYLKEPIPEEDRDLQQQEYLAHQAFMDRPEVMKEIEKYGLSSETSALASREETAKFRINFANRMLYDIRKWPQLMGGRALYNGRVFELTAATYPAAGWDYIQEFKNRSYPVNIIAGDHDFLDFGNRLIKKWTDGIPQVELSIIENSGHMIWVDQPEIFTEELLRHLGR